MADAAILSTGAHLVWGCLGGAIAFLATFALPELRAAAKAQSLKPPTFLKVLVIFGLAAVLILLGGGAAVMLGGATEAKQAIAYGVGSEGLIAGVIRTATG